MRKSAKKDNEKKLEIEFGRDEEKLWFLSQHLTLPCFLILSSN